MYEHFSNIRLNHQFVSLSRHFIENCIKILFLACRSGFSNFNKLPTLRSPPLKQTIKYYFVDISRSHFSRSALIAPNFNIQEHFQVTMISHFLIVSAFTSISVYCLQTKQTLSPSQIVLTPRISRGA